MSAIAFDGLSLVRTIEAVGFPREQAEGIDEKFADIKENMATKADIKDMATKSDIKDVTIRIGGMIMALGTVLVAIKYFG